MRVYDSTGNNKCMTIHRGISDIGKGNSPAEKRVKRLVKRCMNGWVMYRVKILGKVPSQSYRKFMLKHIYKMNLSENVVIYGWDTIRHPWNISIGEGSIIGNDSYLDGRNGLVIGRNVNLSGTVKIHTESHDINDPFFRSLNSGGRVEIGDRVWISSDTIILPGIKVGTGSVVVAGAVVTKNMDEYGIYAGIPAKKIGERSHDLRYEFDGDYLPFI